MRYLPKSPADRAQMLREIGCKSIDDLFAPIPAEYRLNRDLKVPRQMAESEIIDYFQECASSNAAGRVNSPISNSTPPIHSRVPASPTK